MKKPVISDNKPLQTDLDSGKEYHFCACGRSANQPFCDGSHKGTGITPLAFRATQDSAYLCMYKHSRNLPYCDGSHKAFEPDQVGNEGPGLEADTQGVPPVRATVEEPTVEFIHHLAEHSLSQIGHHGPMTAMGVPRHELPHWDDIQIMVAQMARKPLMEEQPVATGLVIGPLADQPLHLDIPLFVSDMSLGALSFEAKVTMARACGHDRLQQFNQNHLATWKHDIPILTGIRYAGMNGM